MGDYKSQFGSLGKINIDLVGSYDAEMTDLAHHLKMLGCNIAHHWPQPKIAPTQGDVLICNFFNQISDLTTWLPGLSPVPLVLYLSKDSYVEFKYVLNCSPHGFLYYPLSEKSIVISIMSAIDAFHYEKRLRSRIDKLDDNLKAIRSVEEAKKLLMDAKHIGESSAYSLLRRSAMERRVRIAVVANEIIEAYKIIA